MFERGCRTRKHPVFYAYAERDISIILTERLTPIFGCGTRKHHVFYLYAERDISMKNKEKPPSGGGAY